MKPFGGRQPDVGAEKHAAAVRPAGWHQEQLLAGCDALDMHIDVDMVVVVECPHGANVAVSGEGFGVEGPLFG